MLCPRCHSTTHVVDCNQIRAGYRRRRECLACKHRFSTLSPDRCGGPETIRILASGMPMGRTYGNDWLFETWLTDDLAITIHLGKLRRAFEAGLTKEEAIRVAQ